MKKRRKKGGGCYLRTGRNEAGDEFDSLGKKKRRLIKYRHASIVVSDENETLGGIGGSEYLRTKGSEKAP